MRKSNVKLDRQYSLKIHELVVRVVVHTSG